MNKLPLASDTEIAVSLAGMCAVVIAGLSPLYQALGVLLFFVR